jgi:hypothetical protein
MKLNKLLKSRKAQESGGGTALPLQAKVELVMIVLVGLAFFIFGAYIMQDQRLAMTYYSKDLSMTINALILVPAIAEMEYKGIPGTISPLKKFAFDFDRDYTTIEFKTDMGVTSTSMKKHYIHLYNEKIPLIEGANIRDPEALFIQKTLGGYGLSKQKKEISKKSIENPAYFRWCKDVLEKISFNANEYIYFDYKNMLISESFLANSPFDLWRAIKMPIGAEDNDKDRINQIDSGSYPTLGIYIGFEKIEDNERITLYMPFEGDRTLACRVYAELLDNYGDNKNIKLIPANSVAAFDNDKRYTSAFYIQMSDSNQRIVFNAISHIIRGIEWVNNPGNKVST